MHAVCGTWQLYFWFVIFFSYCPNQCCFCLMCLFLLGSTKCDFNNNLRSFCFHFQNVIFFSYCPNQCSIYFDLYPWFWTAALSEFTYLFSFSTFWAFHPCFKTDGISSFACVLWLLLCYCHCKTMVVSKPKALAMNPVA